MLTLIVIDGIGDGQREEVGFYPNVVERHWSLIINRYQARAFMLLPMTGNIGQIIGPMIGKFPHACLSFKD
jgi:hypothetical protein